jgi:HKD family nuclease
MLLTRENLLDRLDLLLRHSKSVDIAVAWASDSNALNSVLQFAKRNPGKLRTVVGIAGNATHPNALRALLGCKALRIAPSETLFHPKLYLFHHADKSVAWIGSANLTRPGFQQNEELVFETEDSGATTNWFNKLWARLDEDCSNTVEEYNLSWKPNPPPNHPVNSKRKRLAGPTVRALGGRITEWSSFVRYIPHLNAYWEPVFNCTVDGEVSSWLNTAILGRAVVRRPDWSDLSREDYNLILGIERGNGYGLLGSMKGAGYAKNVFLDPSPQNLRVRRDIRKALQRVIDAPDWMFADEAGRFIASVEQHQGFAGAIATRLMTLARPDRAISVNRGSRARLAAFSDLPETSLSQSPSGTAKSYVDLLHWFESKPWYASPVPANPYEKLLADNRAALFDAFVYQPQ